MGLFFRKSVRFGPFRVNFSNGGLGLSAGIPGFRVSAGPRGNFIQMGAHGIYYRASLGEPSRSSIAPVSRPSHRSPQSISPAIPDSTLGAFQAIESRDAGSISDSSSEELLSEIRRKHKLIKGYPWAMGVMAAAVGGSTIGGLPLWTSISIGVALSVGGLYAYRWDLRRKLVILQYTFDDSAGEPYQALFDSATVLKSVSRVWHVSASAKVLNSKYHAGASATVRRKRATISSAQPPFMACNVNPVTVSFANSTFYFFPDRLLVYSSSNVGAVAYSTLHATTAVSRFIEEEGVPSDAKVVDRTWKFVNKKGGPDKRFKNNRQLPICAYGELIFKSDTGIDELLMISQQGPERAFASALAGMASQLAASSRSSADIMQLEVLFSPHTKESKAKAAGRRVPTVWVRPGETAMVQGLGIAGGMLYIGNTATAADGGIELAQIDPTLEIDPQQVDPDERLFGYWPRYDSISPPARRAYLSWLAGGRSDASANIGYVFLFFYGLERRLLVDALNDPAAKAEVPAIIAEIERLRTVYDNGSFLSYSGNLLDFLAAGDVEPSLCLRPPPPSTASRGMSMRLRVGLGQAALEERPVPAEWALAWVRSEPNVRLPGVARRCARQFDMQFTRSYVEKFGDGLKLSVNRTKLKISYRPASGGLANQSFVSNLADLPDVMTVVTPLKKLQVVIDEVAASLDAYSRFIGRHADRAISLEATLLLPKALWSSTIQSAFDVIDKRVGTGMVVIKLGDLLEALGGNLSFTRETLKSLFHVLDNENIGVEPDVLAGAKTPKHDDSVVLFRLPTGERQEGSGNRANYDAVAVMLDLAITLANADGRISGREVRFLNRQVDAWSHVGAEAQRRLRARLRLGIVYPPTLSSLKSRLEPLPAAARAGLAKLLSALALADGRLAPAAIKHLEKVYHHLGIDVAALYSELHVAAAKVTQTPSSLEPPATLKPSGATSRGAAKGAGLQLDAARVAAVQAETERVTALLAGVFEEQDSAETVAVTVPTDADPEDLEAVGPGLLGLDPDHSAFLRALLSRPRWTRAELQDMAADMELMLDGSLERINEATLEKFDSCIAEGDDPVEIAQELMESASA